MAIRRTQYLQIKPLAGGGFGYYWEPSPALRRANWKRVSFGMSPSDDDPERFALAEARNREVEAWRSGGATPRVAAAILRRHTIGSTVAGYKAYIEARVAENEKRPQDRNPLVGKPMSRNTRDTYFDKLGIILAWGTTPAAAKRDPLAGDILVTTITHDNVLRFRDGLMKPDPKTGHIAWARAHGTLRVLRSMLAWAERQKIIPKGSNPATDFELDTPPSRSAVWDATGGTGDFDTFIQACELLGCPSIALGADIGSWSAQRMSDVLKLTTGHWQRIVLRDQALFDALRGDDPDLKGFVLAQNKTNTPLAIPIVQPLRARVEAAIAANMKRKVPQLTIIINEATGRPYDRFSFSDKFREVREFCANPPADAIAKGFVPRPELRDLWFSDLRRTRVCWLHDRGIDPLGIAMLTGHSPKTVEQILASTYRPRNTRGVSVTLLAAHGATVRKPADREEQA